MSREKILIVDDEIKALKFLEIELTNAGYLVSKALSGQEAVDKAKKEIPQLILMDIMLPDINGAEAVRLLKEDSTTKQIPILFLTAMLRKKEEQECHLGIKVDEKWYRAIAKPFNHQELLREIQEAILKKG